MDEEGALVSAGSGAELQSAFDEGVESAAAGIGIEEEGVKRGIFGEADGVNTAAQEFTQRGFNVGGDFGAGGSFEPGLEFREAGEGQTASLPCPAGQADFVEREGEADGNRRRAFEETQHVCGIQKGAEVFGAGVFGGAQFLELGEKFEFLEERAELVEIGFANTEGVEVEGDGDGAVDGSQVFGQFDAFAVVFKAFAVHLADDF